MLMYNWKDYTIGTYKACNQSILDELWNWSNTVLLELRVIERWEGWLGYSSNYSKQYKNSEKELFWVLNPEQKSQREKL